VSSVIPTVPGPCQAWIDPLDVWSCCESSGVTASGAGVFLDVAQAASEVLYEMSGRQFAGECERVERPCASGCGCWPGLAVPGAAAAWEWGAWGGRWSWRDASCGDLCGCAALSEHTLWTPVREIIEVKVDGAVLAPAEYRVDEREWLVRLGGNRWPACQDLALDASQPGTFQVKYTWGADPPAIGRQAAAQFACQLWLSCTSGTGCTLPAGVVQVQRQGITIDRQRIAAWGYRDGAWSTGLVAVDAFLNAYNPGRMRRAPAVWSPERERRGRRVGT
jgi:hypothetical protein